MCGVRTVGIEQYSYCLFPLTKHFFLTLKYFLVVLVLYFVRRKYEDGQAQILFIQNCCACERIGLPFVAISRFEMIAYILHKMN